MRRRAAAFSAALWTAAALAARAGDGSVEAAGRLSRGLQELQGLLADSARAAEKLRELDYNLEAQVLRYRENVASLDRELGRDAQAAAARCDEATRLKERLDFLAAEGAESALILGLADRRGRAALKSGGADDLVRLDQWFKEAQPLMAGLERAAKEAPGLAEGAKESREEARKLGVAWKPDTDAVRWAQAQHRALTELARLLEEKSAAIGIGLKDFAERKARILEEARAAEKVYRETGSRRRIDELRAELKALAPPPWKAPRDYAGLLAELDRLRESAVGPTEAFACEKAAGADAPVAGIRRSRAEGAKSFAGLLESRKRCAAEVGAAFRMEIAEEARVAEIVLKEELAYETRRLKDFERDSVEWELLRERWEAAGGQRAARPDAEPEAPPPAGALDPAEAGGWAAWGARELQWEPWRVRATVIEEFHAHAAGEKRLLDETRFESKKRLLQWLCPRLAQTRERAVIGASARYENEVVALDRSVDCP